MTRPKTSKVGGCAVWNFELGASLVLGFWTLGFRPPESEQSFAMPFPVPATLESEIDEIIARYPQKRSASLMLLHAVQDHFGWISREAIEWIAWKLELQPINIHELV